MHKTNKYKHGGLAQLVERMPEEHSVVGSTPTSSTSSAGTQVV